MKEVHGENEVLVLAGDIGYPLSKNGKANGAYRDLLQTFRSHWTHIVLITGNHEYYGSRQLGNMDDRDQSVRQVCAELGIHFLQKSFVVINGVRFLGCTLWSDVTLLDYESMNCSTQVFANHLQYVHIHQEHRDWLASQLVEQDSPATVVITHHLPSVQLLPKPESPHTGYFSNLEHLIDTHKIDLWIVGHSHERKECLINGVTCVLNPLGYPNEKRQTKLENSTYTVSCRQGLDIV